MKREVSFWQSLEAYAWKVARRSPLPYPLIIVGLCLIVMMASIFGKGLVHVQTQEEAIRAAAGAGDYPLAERLYQTSGQRVLGASSELEEVVYPVKNVERKIAELEEKLREYPGNREIYLGLAKLYGQMGRAEEAEKYQEMARILDPNE